MKKSAYAGLTLSLLLIALRCMQNPTVDGNGSHTGNPVLTGVVYNASGTRAANAAVKFIPSNYDPISDSNTVVIYSALTNDTGAYTIDSVPADTFNLLASAGVSLGYEDSIRVKSDSLTLAPPCTLKATGSVTGVVQLQPGDDASTVLILFMGTNIIRTTEDAAGNFTVAGLAEGQYKVRIFTTLDHYLPKNTVFTIAAGINDTLPAPIILDYTGIPVPKNVRIEYATLKQIVTLVWDKPTTGTKLQGYNVYRRNVDSNTILAIINRQLVTDTAYRDSTGVQDMTYEYRVAAVDTNTTEGTRSAAVKVTVVSAFRLLDTISVGTVEPTSFSVCRDSVFYLVYRTDGRVTLLDVRVGVQRTINDSINLQAYDISTDSASNVYVTSYNQNKVMKLSQNGDSLAEWIVDKPTLIATGPSDRTYIVFGGSRCIGELGTGGAITNSVTLVGARIVRLQVAPDSNLLAADDYAPAVYEYTPDLTLLRTLAVPTVLPSYQVVAVDSSGNLYVTRQYLVGQSAFYDIAIYNQTCLLLAKFGMFYYAHDAQIVGKALYVLDFADNPWRSQIKKFSLPF